MTPDDYQKAALRTEAPITDEMLVRFSNPDTIKVVWALLWLLHMTGHQSNLLKKHLYYGQNFKASIDTIKPVSDLIDRQHVEPLAMATMQKYQDEKAIRLLHGILGLASEVGELIEPFASFTHAVFGETADLDTTNCLEEIGDIQWYSALVTTICGGSLNNVLETNIAKLRARFPNKFTEQDAAEENRDRAKERAILEGRSTSLPQKIGVETGVDTATMDSPILRAARQIASWHLGQDRVRAEKMIEQALAESTNAKDRQ